MNPDTPSTTRPRPSATLRVEESPPPATIGPAPDAHRVVRDAAGRGVGAYSLWWRDTPPYHGQPVGMIGHVRAGSGGVARIILQEACRELLAAGSAIAFGPIDGSTWSNYRLVTDSDDSPPFFLEPAHPAATPGYFRDNGFRCELTYRSLRDGALDREDPLADRTAREMEDAGISLRPLRLGEFDLELRRLHALASECFRSHDLYRDLPVARFIALYEPMKRLIDPDLTLIAERDACPVGFAFAIPDVLEQERTGAARTLILKTLGVVPGGSAAGLGYHLLAAIRRRAARAGYERMILALMRDTAYVARRRTDLGTPFRRYGLFARTLSP